MIHTAQRLIVFCGCVMGISGFSERVCPAGDPLAAAREVDLAIDASLPGDGERAPRTNDEDFLRRVTLDLTGTVPSPNEVTAFGLNPDPQKRSKLVDQLLGSEEYSRNWARYWSDVIYTNATEERARITQSAFEDWLSQQFAADASWDAIATEMLTATGSISEEGRTALIFAHTGQPEELAGEVSRIFLGIQIQCANCHDHPTDSWTREQFHTLAAFFPRIQVRPETPGDIRTFIVTSMDQPERRPMNFDPEQQFARLDRNRDGKVEKSEAENARFIGDRFTEILRVADKDDDGALSKDEFVNIPRPPADQPGRGASEYYMPDLNNPSSRGTRLEPVFFIDGTSLDLGTNDLDRRNALAEAITSHDNEWFAKAFVNRIWGEMTGRGFYMPIDDLGPLREATCPDALAVLADGFTEQNYDVKWVFRAIANTETYQRQIRTADPAAETPPFASAIPTRLRADQVYNSVLKVLGVEQLAGNRGPQRGRYGMNRDPGRAAFAELFGFDPSTPQEDIVGSIPQALFLMNSPQVNALVRGNGDTRLGRILRDYDNNDDALAELYLLTLSREPSAEESAIAAGYITEVGNRAEAFEDLFWSLLNSSEFLSRRELHRHPVSLEKPGFSRIHLRDHPCSPLAMNRLPCTGIRCRGAVFCTAYRQAPWRPGRLISAT